VLTASSLGDGDYQKLSKRGPPGDLPVSALAQYPLNPVVSGEIIPERLTRKTTKNVSGATVVKIQTINNI
jgi:hypothetical protein